MHLAAGAGSAEAIRLLAAAGADVDAREGAHRQTPLHWAAAFNRLEAVRALLALGADPAATTDVVDYVQLAAFDGPDRMRRQKLVVARREAAKEAEAQRQALLAGGATTVADVAAAQLQAREEPAAAASRQADEPARSARDSTRVPGGATSSTGGTGGGAPAARSGNNAERPLSYTDLVGKEGGLAPLHYAAREGHIDVALALLDAGADVNQPTAGDHTTPLLMAAINGNYDLAMELIARGADPNIVSEDGVAPLFATLNNRWAPKAFYPQPTMFKQQETSYLELMKALLEAGADVNHRIGRHVWYTSYNFDILGVKFDGATAFWRAAYATDVKAMKLLVAYGADPDIPTKKTPRRRFRWSRQNADQPDPSGLSPVPNGGPAVYPIHAASGVGYGVARAGNSHRHVPDGWLPAVKYLVEELGADVNVRDHDGYSAVHHAAARGDNELIKYLVSKGAIVTFVSRRGQTTVDMANGPQQRVQPFPETIALLEGLGAKNNHNCLSC